MNSEIDTRLTLLELAIAGIARATNSTDLLIEHLSKMRQELAKAEGVHESELPGAQLLVSLKSSQPSQSAD